MTASFGPSAEICPNRQLSNKIIVSSILNLMIAYAPFASPRTAQPPSRSVVASTKGYQFLDNAAGDRSHNLDSNYVSAHGPKDLFYPVLFLPTCDRNFSRSGSTPSLEPWRSLAGRL